MGRNADGIPAFLFLHALWATAARPQIKYDWRDRFSVED
jgi:hypothetical protein